MKYIRTKDGRIIDLKNWSSVETICVNAETNKTEKDICYQRTWFEHYGDTCEYKTEYISHNSQVSNQADTIEELCDELVFDNFYHSRMTPSAMQTKENQKIIKGYLKQNITCYGAIWTEWGLKYVAKMNDKGELELL